MTAQYCTGCRRHCYYTYRLDTVTITYRPRLGYRTIYDYVDANGITHYTQVYATGELARTETMRISKLCRRYNKNR